MTTPTDSPQEVELEAEASLGAQGKTLQESFEQAEHKGARPFFAKLEGGASFVCPDSIQDPGEHVEGLILYQTMEEDTQTEKTTGDMVEAAGDPGSSVKAPACLPERMEEVSERQMDHEPFIVSMVQPCQDMTGKPVQHLVVKSAVMELESIYSGYTQHSSPSAPNTTPPIASLSNQGVTKSIGGVKVAACVDQETYEMVAGDGSLLRGVIECGSRTLLHEQSGQDEDELRPHDSETAPVSPPDTKPSPADIRLSSDGGCGDKPEELQLPVKTEEAEPAEDSDSSDVKPGKFLSAVKAEDVVPKDEQLDYPIKVEALNTKSELAVSVKPESFDGKRDVYSDFSGGAKLKTETKPEDLELGAYPDSSEEKCKAKAEPLEFSIPDIKAKIKQELLEADSTVLTPKLEQSDGLPDAAVDLVAKAQAKKSSVPGNHVIPQGAGEGQRSEVCWGGLDSRCLVLLRVNPRKEGSVGFGFSFPASVLGGVVSPICGLMSSISVTMRSRVHPSHLTGSA